MERRTFLQLAGLGPLVQVARNGAAPGGAERTQTAEPDVDLALTASQGEVNVLSGTPTRVWRFEAELLRGPASTVQVIPGSYLGPVLRLRRGQRVRIRFRNRLGEPSIIHWHGLDVPELADGHPRLAVGHGSEYVYEFEVINRAGTYWYHPHPHMRTGAQVYQGLAGVVLVSDEEEDALRLPTGTSEIICVLQDRRFDSRQQFVYASGSMGGGMFQMMEMMNGWLGDRALVSGQVSPTIDVDRRTLRVRMLNGSNARIYKLAWSDGSPMTIIGGDGGLLDRARVQHTLTIAPGQRADVLLDLSTHAAGGTVRLESVAFPAADVGRVGMNTAPVPQGAQLTLMTLRASGDRGPRYSIPARLSADDFEPVAAPVRRVPLSFRQMTWLLDGRVFDMQDVSREETFAAGSTHTWELVNEVNPMGMAMAHPIHLHGRQFRVLSRTGGVANALREGINDAGWLDTVLVLPGETVRVQVTFSRFPGLYLYHCHILEHEDMGMMRNFRIA